MEKCPWSEISKGWIGRSMGWKQQSMGRIDAITPSRRISNAKTQTSVGVRINRVPYSAQGYAACKGTHQSAREVRHLET